MNGSKPMNEQGGDAPQLTLGTLVTHRVAVLGLSDAQLAERLHIRNPNKARDFHARLEAEDMRGMEHMRRPLAQALGLTPAHIDQAIAASRAARQARQEADWRTAFVPHAVLDTARPIPQPVFAAAVSGADKKLRMDLPHDRPALGWPALVARALPPGLPGYGRVTGFFINWTPDAATRFDRTGTPLEKLDHAVRRGVSTMRPSPIL